MRVLITGAAGHIGRALTDAYMRQGDEVDTLDLPGSNCDFQVNLDGDYIGEVLTQSFDVVVCNAKCRDWYWHNELARRATRAIVNVSSIYGVVGPDPALYENTEVEPTPPYYAASKGAMIALTRWQASTFAPVRSNCVVVGGIFRNHSVEFVKRYSAKVPLGRMATEDDIVGPIMFLASDAARYVNGAILAVDGGFTCR